MIIEQPTLRLEELVRQQQERDRVRHFQHRQAPPRISLPGLPCHPFPRHNDGGLDMVPSPTSPSPLLIHLNQEMNISMPQFDVENETGGGTILSPIHAPCRGSVRGSASSIILRSLRTSPRIACYVPCAGWPTHGGAASGEWEWQPPELGSPDANMWMENGVYLWQVVHVQSPPKCMTFLRPTRSQAGP